MLGNIKPKDQFARNVLTLMTGTTVAQAIPIVITPLLTRLYTPADFGLLALFVSISTIFGSIANGRYELAIMLPLDDDDAFNIAALGVIIATLLSVCLLFIVFVFHDNISTLLNNDALDVWLYFVPCVVWLIGVFNVLTYFNNRMQNYKGIAQANIYKSLVLVVCQVGFALTKTGAAGLITGYICSNLVANMKLLTNVLNDFDVKAVLSLKAIKHQALRYIRFPKFSLFAVLANTLSTQLTSILISLLFSVSTLGFYSVAQKILGVPSMVIGGSVGYVFFNEALAEKQQTGKAIKSFDSALTKLLYVSIPFFLALYFIIEDVFLFVFGEGWQVAGEYGKILIPYFFIRFIAASLSNLNNAFEKQGVAMVWQFTLLFICLTCITLSKVFDWSFTFYLYVFTYSLVVHYAILLVVLHRVSRGKL